MKHLKIYESFDSYPLYKKIDEITASAKLRENILVFEDAKEISDIIKSMPGFNAGKSSILRVTKDRSYNYISSYFHKIPKNQNYLTNCTKVFKLEDEWYIVSSNMEVPGQNNLSEESNFFYMCDQIDGVKAALSLISKKYDELSNKVYESSNYEVISGENFYSMTEDRLVEFTTSEIECIRAITGIFRVVATENDEGEYTLVTANTSNYQTLFIFKNDDEYYLVFVVPRIGNIRVRKEHISCDGFDGLIDFLKSII